MAPVRRLNGIARFTLWSFFPPSKRAAGSMPCRRRSCSPGEAATPSPSLMPAPSTRRFEALTCRQCYMSIRTELTAGKDRSGSPESAGRSRSCTGISPLAQPERWASASAATDPTSLARLAPVPRLVGINHVALEVESVEDALEFYGRIFELELRGRAGRMAFIDIGDQFIALSEGRTQPPDRARHIGLVVDDKEATRQALIDAGVELQPGRGLDFLDPWGNHVQVVDYREVQFSKAPAVLRAMGIGALEKTPAAKRELRSKG